MAIQILKRSPTFKEEIGRGLGAGLGEGLRRGMEARSERKRAEALQQQQEMQEAQENESISQSLGIDLSGIRDPKMRQEVLGQALQGKRAEQLEMLKQGSKGQREQEKQNFLNQLLGGQKEQSNQGQQEGMGQQFDPSQLTDAQIARASAMDPNLGRALGHAKDVALREKSAQQSREFEREKLERKETSSVTTPILKEMNESRKNIPLQEQAILDIEEAAPNVSAQDYLAEVTGFEPFRTEHGAKLKTAIKDFFLSDLTRAGARPNMWIEQQLADALPKIGRSKEANLITAQGMRFKVDLAKKRIDEIDRLAEEDREKYGYVKPDIDSRAIKNMKKFVIDRQAELKQSIEKIKANNKGKKEMVKMRSPDGKMYEILSDDIDEAIQNDFNFAD